MDPHTMQTMVSAFQVAAGFSAYDFELVMRCLIAIFLAAWAILLLACWIQRASQDGIDNFFWRIIGLGLVATLMGVYIGGS